MADLYLLPDPPASEVERLAQALVLSPVLARLLWHRGHRDPATARAWLQPSFDAIGDPYLFRDMEKAVQRVRRALKERERIIIHGDYDVDGLAGTVLLLSFLKMLGAEVDYHIPARDDGYSFSEASIRAIRDGGYRVCISVDNGSAAVSEVAAIQALGCDVIITDHHHTGPEVAPAFASLNPRLPGSGYPFPWLAGCAVAFKLAWGIAQSFSPHRIVEAELRSFLVDAASLVALGSVADVVPLIEENRALVRVGLKALLQSPSPGLRALVDIIGPQSQSLFVDDISFRIGPRLNAAGRMGHASLAVRLLTATSYGEARAFAKELETLNRDRQQVEGGIAQAAIAAIEADAAQKGQRVLVVAGQGWHLGVVGIVAARLADLYRRPAIVLAVHDGVARGSGRSHGDVDLRALCASASEPLSRFGGHAAAVGMEMPAARVGEFTQKVQAAAASLPAILRDEIRAEVNAPLSHWDTPELRKLAEFRPFGNGNPPPLFLAQGVRIGTGLRRVGPAQRGLAFTAIHDGIALRALAPAHGPRIEEFLARPAPWHLVYTPRLSSRADGSPIELQVHGIEAAIQESS